MSLKRNCKYAPWFSTHACGIGLRGMQRTYYEIGLIADASSVRQTGTWTSYLAVRLSLCEVDEAEEYDRCGHETAFEVWLPAEPCHMRGKQRLGVLSSDGSCYPAELVYRPM